MDTATKTAGTTVVSSQLRGETIAYAIQNCVYNVGANFFEPAINCWFQKRYATDPEHKIHGNYTQNLAGEFAGDFIGSTTLVAAEALVPEQLHYFTRGARNFIDPLYDTVARHVLINEAKEPDFEKKVKDWKVFQERNLIRSGIMTTAAIAGNLATQKLLLGNPSPARHILEGKLISGTITTAIGLATRFMFPTQLKKVDKWMGERIAPLMEDKEIDALPSTQMNQVQSITPYQMALQR